MRILQVNLQSDRGGDGRIVSDLHQRYLAAGHSASLLVGRGIVTAEAEEILPNDAYRSAWARGWLAFARGRLGHARSTSAKLASWIAEPDRRRRIRSGFEDFDFPATLPVISNKIREGPTILHLHNLHGGYFDLRALPKLTHLTPTILTLHDQWAFTGHCGYSFDCARWKSGCGSCPDLTIYPGIPKDRTAENFVNKRQIFARSRLYLTAPSKWLMEMARQSLLAPAIEEMRVIPNGVDTTYSNPGTNWQRERVSAFLSTRASCFARDRSRGPIIRQISVSFGTRSSLSPKGTRMIGLSCFLDLTQALSRQPETFASCTALTNVVRKRWPATTGLPTSICTSP